jgi:hypothetical protein
LPDRGVNRAELQRWIIRNHKQRIDIPQSPIERCGIGQVAWNKLDRRVEDIAGAMGIVHEGAKWHVIASEQPDDLAPDLPSCTRYEYHAFSLRRPPKVQDPVVMLTPRFRRELSPPETFE